jgi:hypothetical protein
VLWESIVLFFHLLANVLHDGLTGVVFETMDFTHDLEIVTISLSLSGASIKHIANSKDVTKHFKVDLVCKNNIINSANAFMELISSLFTLIP